MKDERTFQELRFSQVSEDGFYLHHYFYGVVKMVLTMVGPTVCFYSHLLVYIYISYCKYAYPLKYKYVGLYLSLIHI